MAMDMFIKIDSIPGESKDKTHPGEIDVLAWSWGLSQSGTFSMGGGGGSGKVNVQDISFTKYVDKSSPKLQLCAIKGTHITEATLVVRKAGDTPLEYITMTFKKLLVSSVSTGGSGGEDRLTENVTLNFAEVKFSYQEQNATGAAEGAAVDYTYNVEENAVS